MVAEAPPTTRRAILLAGLATASGAAAVVAWIAFRPEPPERLVLQAGKTANVSIPIPPGKSNGRSEIEVGDIPAGITQVKRVDDEPSAGMASFLVEADLNADLSVKKRTLTFLVNPGKDSRTEVVDVTILKPQVAPLPPGFLALPDARLQFVGREVYPTHIARSFGDGDDVEFLLVAKGRDGGPGDFYIMKDKVSIRLYSKFAAARPTLTGADLGARADDRLPMMGVTVQEAYDFAQWLGGPQDDSSTAQTPHEGHIRAHLPTIKQWDKAAGFFDRQGREGPYLMTWAGLPGEIAVGRKEEEGPMPVGTATHDISWIGCRDMAGNGLEWTRNVAFTGESAPFPPTRSPSSSCAGSATTPRSR